MKLRMTALVLLALCGWPASTCAQVDAATGVAASFEQLRVLVRPGNTVTVTDAAGSEVTGRIERLSSSLLSLDVDGAPRNFSETDVNLILQRRGDSLANGAWWGAGIAAALLAVAIAACDECHLHGPADYVAAAFATGAYAAMGAGVGVGIDALKRHEQTIYRRPGLNLSFRF